MHDLPLFVWVQPPGVAVVNLGQQVPAIEEVTGALEDGAPGFAYGVPGAEFAGNAAPDFVVGVRDLDLGGILTTERAGGDARTTMNANNRLQAVLGVVGVGPATIREQVAIKIVGKTLGGASDEGFTLGHRHHIFAVWPGFGTDADDFDILPHRVGIVVHLDLAPRTYP